MKTRIDLPARRNRSTTTRRRTFLAQLETLEPRHMLTGSTLSLTDNITTRADGDDWIILHLSVDTPLDHLIPVYHSWNQVAGTTDAFDEYTVDWITPGIFNGAYYPGDVTEIDFKVTGYTWDPWWDPNYPIEYAVVEIVGYDPGGISHTSNTVTFYLIDNETDIGQATSSVAQISDEPCSTCPQPSGGTNSISNTQTGNLTLDTPDPTGLTSYRPRYSTNALRPAVALANTQYAFNETPDALILNGTYYDTSSAEPGETFQLGELIDTSALGPGRYPWTLEITEVHTGDPDFTYPIHGHTLFAGPSNALISPGWAIPAIDRLTVSADGALWQSGDQLLWFTEEGGSYLRPDGDASYSELVDNLDGTYTITNRWGDTVEFNTLGLVSQKIDRYGRPTTFTYTDEDSDSDNDDISEVELFDGRTLTYHYTSDRISSITDFDGREIFYAYDGNDQLETITYPDPDDTGPLDPQVTSFTYQTGTSFVETVDDNGDVTEFTYDFAGALVERENQDATIEEFQNALILPLVDPGSGLGTSLNPAPLVLRSEAFAIQENADGDDTQYILGPLGLPIAMIDAEGNVTTYERDANGRVIHQVDPDPDGVGGEDPYEMFWVYDNYGNLLEQILPDESVRTWTYDATWNIPTSYTDERGLVTLYDVNATTGLVDSIRLVVGEVDDLVNLEEDDVVTSFTYTAAPSDPADPPFGLVETETDPLGRVTTYTYNARGQVTSVTYADGTADEATASTYYNTDGTVDYTLDELGRRTDHDYDLLGRLILTTLPDPDAGGPLARPEIAFEYNTLNQLVKQTDELGRETLFTYDERSRVTKVELPDHDGDTQLTTTTTKYNDRGLVEKITDPLGRETSFTYDKIGRKTKTTLPEVPDWTTAVDEVQIIDFDSGTEGTFKLNGNSKDGTIDLADISDFQTVLDSIWGAGNTSVKVTSTEATITFRGDQAATNVAQMTISDITGTKGATPFVSTDTAGVAPTLVTPTLETAYDPLGRVISEKDAQGNETTYEYTNFGHSVKITLPDPDGAGTGYTSPVIYREYDAAWNLISEKDGEGGETKYGYNILGQLVTITGADPDGGGPLTEPVTSIAYDLAGNQRFVTDPLGNVTENQYDNRNRLVKVIAPDPDGPGPQTAGETTYTFDDASQLTQVTDALGRETSYDYDGLSRTTKITLPDPDGAGTTYTSPEILYGYDAAGRKTKETDALLNVTEFAYDDLDNLIQVTAADPDGKGPQTSPVSKWEYDDAGQLLNSTDARGNVTTYTHDNWGRQITITGADPDAGGPLAAPGTKYFFDLNSNLISTLDPLKLLTTTVYDALNRVVISRDALGGETTFTYDDNGNVMTLTDPVENTTYWTYDLLNRVVEEKNQLGDSRYFVYDAASNLIQKTDRNERVTIYEHDNLHRVVAEEWWDGTRPSIDVSTLTEGSAADENQRVGFTSSYAIVSGTFTLTFSGQTTSAIAWDASAGTVEAALEALSNIADGDVSVTKSNGNEWGQEWEVTFVGGLAGTDVAQIAVDPANVDNGTDTPTPVHYTITDGYQINEEQVVTLSDATGGTFTLSFGGVATEPIDWDASSGEVDSALEALSGAGTVSVSGSPGGPYTITFTGDYGGQDIAPLLSRANDLTNGDLLEVISFEYDAVGRLLAAGNSAATNEFNYDDLGRVLQEAMSYAGFDGTITLDQVFDLAGNREQSRWNFGTTEELTSDYLYDALRRMTQITNSSDEQADYWHRVQFSYNELGQFDEINRFVGDNTTPIAVADSNYVYDGLNRLTSILHTTDTTTWAGYDYVYDIGSRITSIDSYLDGLSDFTYDNTNQLVGADHTGSTDETYEFDANGNRIMSGYDIDPNNQLFSDGTYNYTYDDEGNRETRTRLSDNYVTVYTWDFRNRLIGVTEEDDSTNVLSTVTNGYDAFDRWIHRSVDADGPGGTDAIDTVFAWDGLQLALELTDDNALPLDGGDLAHIYNWGPATDQLLADFSDGDIPQWALSDHLNTPRDFVSYNDISEETDPTGHQIFDAFGNNTFTTGFTSFLGFAGRPFEISFGWNYNSARWYDPATGNWATQDPISFGANDYNITRYVHNRPTDQIDPLGLEGDSFISGVLQDFAMRQPRQYIVVDILLGGAQILRDGYTITMNVQDENPVWAMYVVGGTLAGTAVGVRQVDDYFWTHDAVDGHVQSDEERLTDLITGTMRLGGTAFGIRAVTPGLSKLGSTPSLFNPTIVNPAWFGFGPGAPTVSTAKAGQYVPNAQLQTIASGYGQAAEMPVAPSTAVSPVQGLYGPFWRGESSAGVAAIQESRMILGNPPTNIFNYNGGVVQALPGPLPPGRTGPAVQFYTPVPPRIVPVFGGQAWWEGTTPVHQIPVVVTGTRP